MSAIHEFWLILLETLYLPIYHFFGYDAVIALIFWVIFTAMQVWVWWHFFFKPIIWVIKKFLYLISPNKFWKYVEVDEKNRSNCH